MSNAPTFRFGDVPLIRAVVRSATTDTAVTVTPDDSGTMFVSLSTTGNVTYTLPTVANAAGKTWIFFNGCTSYAIVVTGGTAAVMMADDRTNYDYVTSAAEVGEWCIVTCDGTNYYVLAGHGTWTAST